jgi:N-glycosylase/DNA lyase
MIKHIITDCLDLDKTLFCGQAFRWQKDERSGNSKVYSCISGDKYIRVRQEDDGITFLNVAEDDLPYWRRYFSLDEDYPAILKALSRDETLAAAVNFAYGIRLLRQEPFETLISFIISQNNNIPRITGIISRLCEHFGEPINTEDGIKFAFPTAAVLDNLGEDDLAVIRAGFRARYIKDAARKCLSGVIDLQSLFDLSFEDAKAELMSIVGVGDKVADCVLLFAFGKGEAVPKDVWIKRALSRYYPANHGSLPACAAGYEGIAQQYLFHYIRHLSTAKQIKDDLALSAVN